MASSSLRHSTVKVGIDPQARATRLKKVGYKLALSLGAILLIGASTGGQPIPIDLTVECQWYPGGNLTQMPWKLTIMSDGKAVLQTWDLGSEVKKVTELSTTDLRDLAATIRNAGFFALKAEYGRRESLHDGGLRLRVSMNRLSQEVGITNPGWKVDPQEAADLSRFRRVWSAILRKCPLGPSARQTSFNRPDLEQHELSAVSETETYKAAYLHGWAEADENLRQGEAQIFVAGPRDHLENVDHETALPVLDLGRELEDATRGRLAGNNNRIVEFIEKHGSPSNSYKRWTRGLFDMAAYFAEREQAGATVRLAAQLSPMISPDDRLVIRVEKRPPRRETPDWRILLNFASPVLNKPWVETLRYRTSGECDLTWGMEDSHLVFFRWTLDRKVSYADLDTRAPAHWLRLVHEKVAGD